MKFAKSPVLRQAIESEQAELIADLQQRLERLAVLTAKHDI